MGCYSVLCLLGVRVLVLIDACGRLARIVAPATSTHARKKKAAPYGAAFSAYADCQQDSIA
jgi:hypothetical protein